MAVLAPPIVEAVSQLNPFSGVPEIAITATNTEIFNLVGEEDASFEIGLGSVLAITNCAIADSTAVALDGIRSLSLTALADGSMAARVGPYPVSPSTLYTYTAAYFAASATRTVRTDVEWYLDGTFVSTTTGSTSTDSATLPWTAPGSLPTVTSPSGVDQAYIVFNVLSASGPIASPGTPTVTPTGVSGSTPYHYEITSVNPYGETPASAIGATTTGNATLSATNFNALSWTGSAPSYNVYRSAQLTCAGIPLAFTTCAAVAASVATCADLIDLPGTPVLIANTTSTTFDDTGFPLGTQLAPTANTTGEVHYVDEVGLFPGTATEWGIFETGVITILRSDGEYVLGASPLFPLMLPTNNSAVMVTDLTAAYGKPVTYVAILISDSTTMSPPSIPSAPVVMGQAPDTLTLYNRLGWPQEKDESGQLLAWLSGVGELLQGLDNLFVDQIDDEGNYYPGPSQLLDIHRCPTNLLTWLGQFVGVSVDPSLRDDQQRYSILQEAGFKRGTPAAIIAAANRFVQVGSTASIAERDSSPYHLTITIPEAGIEGPGSCLALSRSYAACSDLPGAFATCADLWESTVAVTAAVQAAIPAGLNASISFV